MTTMSIQLPERSEKIGKFVNHSEKRYRWSPITFDYVEKFYTNENGCVDFDKFETVQELVEYMIDHSSITNYWHTTNELKMLDKIRYRLSSEIRVFKPVYQNGIIISDCHTNDYMEIKHTMFDIRLDTTMNHIKFDCFHCYNRNLTEDDRKYTIRDLIRIYHNDVPLHNEYVFDGAKLKHQEELNRQEELKQQKKMQRQEEVKRQKEMQQEEETQRKVKLKLQEKMRQEEIDRMRTEMNQLRTEMDQLRAEMNQLRDKTPRTINASVPWHLQQPQPISTVFGQCSVQTSSVRPISTVFEQSTTTSSFM